MGLGGRTCARATRPVRRSDTCSLPPSALARSSQRGGGAGGPPRHYEGAKKLAWSCSSQVSHACPCGVTFLSFMSYLRIWCGRTSRPRPEFGLKPTRPAARRRETPRSGRDPPRLAQGDLAARSRRGYGTLCTCCLFHVFLRYHTHRALPLISAPGPRGLTHRGPASGLGPRRAHRVAKQRGLLEASIPLQGSFHIHASLRSPLYVWPSPPRAHRGSSQRGLLEAAIP